MNDLVTLERLVEHWLEKPDIAFSRKPEIAANHIRCDCAGFVTLLSQHLSIPTPYGIEHPKAVHYFAVLQEIGSNHITQVKAGHIMAWRKDHVPKTGDTGHVLLINGVPIKKSTTTYEVAIIDATKLKNGLAKRKMTLHTNDQGKIIGVQLHETDSKVKRTPIYHAPLLGSRYCLGCGLPQKVCMCNQVEVSTPDAPIIILRHPDERRQTLSTVSLIKQRYPKLLVKEGALFDPLRAKNLWLVFPDENSQATVGQSLAPSFKQLNSPSPELSQEMSQELSPEARQKPFPKYSNEMTMIVLDATWRKAKKILHDNPWLSSLPRLNIESTSISDYLVRKVPNESALATVEAVAYLQEDKVLQELFNRFIDKQIDVMGEDVYRQNYQQHLNYTPKDAG